MKTIVLYMTTATLINAGVFLRDIGVLALAALVAIVLYNHTKTLKVKPCGDSRDRIKHRKRREM